MRASIPITLVCAVISPGGTAQARDPRMFAAVILISLTGSLILMAFTLLSNLALRTWQESAIRREP